VYIVARRLPLEHAIMLEGEMPNEHSIYFEKRLSGITGKFKLVVELPGRPGSVSAKEEFRRHFTNIRVDLSGFKFDRDEANER
jgi:hypothetical protein